MDRNYYQEIKRCLLLGRKAMTKLDSILNSRDITLPTKVRIVKSMVFPVVMCEYESWTIKKAEYRETHAFKLWYWRLLRVPLMAKRSNQSNLESVLKSRDIILLTKVWIVKAMVFPVVV